MEEGTVGLAPSTPLGVVQLSVLQPLFDVGHLPDDTTLAEAYPFGERWW